MTKSHSLIIGASIVLGCLILGLSSSNPAVGDSSVSPPAGGKYQLVVTEPANGADSKVFVFEPNTGHCWFKATNAGLPNWRDLGSPVIQSGK
ncbi:MAG: hypothetical protein JWN70_3398 [Planctomycetaceae bacterium]|nr:hypothetical protein [Planctomycetaceae bacterium]